ncbi:MAG TPA: ABC transporter permease [Terriglobales bacterium]|nr:ABC transporter permease [Terriglobales bacterium]
MLQIAQDFRFALRTVFKDRAFFAAAVIALALGIGSTTAIFSVLYNVVLDPFPYTDSERIVGLEIWDARNPTQQWRNDFSVPEFLDYQEQSHSFDQTMGVWEESAVMGSAESPELLDVDTVTGNTFQFLGVAPLLGRAIEPPDAETGAPPVFVLSYKVWVRRFGMDPSIVGQTFTINGKPTTLIGVMPRRFAFWGGDIWMPVKVDRAETGAAKRRFVLYGRLKRGLPLKAAETELTGLARRFSQVYRADYPEQPDARLSTLAHFLADRMNSTLYTLLGAVGLLLLIACANVANLLLAKAATREREFALRMTLGAGRMRLIRQLMVENLVLALVGASLGCVLAAFGLKGLVAMVPLYTFPDEALIQLNTPVLCATIAIAVLTSFIFGLAPAWSASRSEGFSEVLKGGSRGNTVFRDARKSGLLVASEVALSILLLSASGLLMRSFFLERQVDVGVRVDHLLMTQLALPAKIYTTAESQTRYIRELLPRLERLPGVVSAASANNFPSQGGLRTEFDVPGITHSQKWRGHVTPASERFFDTVGVRLLAGRLPAASGENGKRRIAVVNESLVRAFFGGRNPVGRWLAIKLDPLAGPPFEIVGVVSDVKNEGIRQPATPEAYIPYTIAGFGGSTIFLRTSVPPERLAPLLEREVLTVDRNVAPQNTMTMDAGLDLLEYARPRFGLILLSVFAAIGLILVSVGVYSVISYNVTGRLREIGIRMALGAETGNVRSLVLGMALRFIATGIVAGLILTLGAGRALASQVWGIRWYDPITLGAVILVMTVVGLLAAYAPALRATRVDPAVSLRQE